MKIGIIIHSYTGNTLFIGEELKKALLAKGYDVKIERVLADNEDPKFANKAGLKEIPSIKDYDVLIFGAPVRAFSLSPIMKLYLKQLDNLDKKDIYLFVTQQFPKPWLGGNNAIKQMKQVLNGKGTIKDTGIINESSKNKLLQIEDIIARFTSL